MVQILHLIDCSHATSLVQDPIKQALGKLKSQIASDYMQQNLISTDQARALPPRGTLPPVTQHEDMVGGPGTYPIPLGGINVSDVPVTPEVECAAAGCRITGGGCQRLKDRFLVVNAGITDRKRELDLEIGSKEDWCEKTSILFETNLNGMNIRLRKEHGDLAYGTKSQNDNEEGSHQRSQQHASISAKYIVEMTTCCDNQNNAKGTICALEKIRTKVNELKGDDAGLYFVDCSTSDWSDEECTVTCGGGYQRKTRTVITQPQGGGVPCPPLVTLVHCNEFNCPTDCEMTDWEQWSGCSADCGGGVKERTRAVTRAAAFNGDACDETESEEACHVQNCDEDCELSDWSVWGDCSKVCGKGARSRTKIVMKEAKGNGHCGEPESEERRQFDPCNDFFCSDRLEGTNRTTLMCDSKVDVIIVLDGSASLQAIGWKQSHEFTKSLLQSMAGNGTNVRVALQVFSGPDNWDDYELCIGATQIDGGITDMKETCGIEWIEHFTQYQGNISDLADKVGAFEESDWPRSTTLTSVALGEAESELYRGRDDANSVVIVITDGFPMSKLNTQQAAKALQSLPNTKVVWVPVGKNAPINFIESMASAPAEDHVIQIDDFEQLETSWAVNRIISTTCPIVA